MMGNNRMITHAAVEVTIARTDSEIIDCFQVLRILRPHLEESSFIQRIRRQQAQGYNLAFIRDQDRVSTAAGYRIAEFLAWGKVFYVDDLITDPTKERNGFGGTMMNWLMATAGRNKCAEFHLDSGHQRHAAHRLYLNKGLRLTSHHFSLKMDSPAI